MEPASRGTGHGAEPVRAALSAKDAEITRLRAELEQARQEIARNQDAHTLTEMALTDATDTTERLREALREAAIELKYMTVKERQAVALVRVQAMRLRTQQQRTV
jgi:hypothetical protein